MGLIIMFHFIVNLVCAALLHCMDCDKHLRIVVVSERAFYTTIPHMG